MKRIIFLLLIFFICSTDIFIFESYAYSALPSNSSEKSSDTAWYRYLRYNDLVLTVTDSSVAMTQDDNYYTFNISQKTYNNYGSTCVAQDDDAGYNYGALGSFSSAYIGRYSNGYSLEDVIEEDSTSTKVTRDNRHTSIGGTYLHRERYTYSDGYIENTNFDTYYYNGLHKKTGETRSIVGPSISMSSNVRCNNPDTSSSSYYYYPSINATINATIKVKKDEIDIFRYYMPLNSRVCYKTYPSKSTSTYNFYCASVNQSVDLKSYIDCGHDWEIGSDISRDYHTICCKNCKWNKKVSHEYLYEYDGIENNRCICNVNKNIRIKICDNVNQYDEEYIATPGDAMYKMELERVGYFYQDITDNEKYYDNNLNKYDDIVNTIYDYPDIVPDNSHTYIMNYKPHTYKINFMKENSYGFDFDNNMESQVFNYGEKIQINKSEYQVVGYTFVGWACKPDLETVVFKDGIEIYNLSPDDLYELNVYPVFDPYKYTVHFACSRNAGGYMPDQKFTYGVCENIQKCGYVMDEDCAFTCWTYNDIDIKPANSATIDKFVHHNNQYLVFDAKLYVYDRNHKTNPKPLVDNTIKNYVYVDKNKIIDTHDNAKDNHIRFDVKNNNKKKIVDDNKIDIFDKERYGIVFYQATKSNISKNSDRIDKSYNSTYFLDSVILSMAMMMRMFVLFSVILSMVMAVFMLKNRSFLELKNK